MTLPTPRIDAHLHLWDLGRSAYSWITPELGPLHTTITAERAHAELDACGIDRAVLVQAEDSAADTAFMLEVADTHDWVAGVVGWVRLDDPVTAQEQLDRWLAHPAFRGVRHLVHDDPRDDFLALPAVRESLGLLADAGIAFDVPDAWPRHLGAVADLAAALPELTVVLDHLGKPPAAQADFVVWRTTLAEIAAAPNTVAKVSGLQVRGRPFTVAGVRPAWEAALELFGPDRLLWGSDWPMTLLTAGYAGTWEVMAALVDELTADERATILSGTATRVYRLAGEGSPR
ncbi:amidohydrolase family protein [Pseudonocardia humida]|uniref:Amidohydrolase family protein n=1 Tax=Pseudonocardia humida TaxID=2800819 RepID=A0ABT1A471_9PSEU|nr:amidohydrolase family protein [Pseudonocardia humida]MCO1657755.1 amidohydrolase family protein [Pseudonocardia humida]